MKFVPHSIKDEQKVHTAAACVHFHSDLQGESTIAQLHHDWRHVLDLSLESWNKIPEYWVENTVTT